MGYCAPVIAGIITAWVWPHVNTQTHFLNVQTAHCWDREPRVQSQSQEANSGPCLAPGVKKIDIVQCRCLRYFQTDTVDSFSSSVHVELNCNALAPVGVGPKMRCTVGTLLSPGGGKQLRFWPRRTWCEISDKIFDSYFKGTLSWMLTCTYIGRSTTWLYLCSCYTYTGGLHLSSAEKQIHHCNNNPLSSWKMALPLLHDTWRTKHSHDWSRDMVAPFRSLRLAQWLLYLGLKSSKS